MKALATNPEDICTGNAGCHTFSYEGVSNFGHEIMAINFAVVMPSHIKALATMYTVDMDVCYTVVMPSHMKALATDSKPMLLFL